MLQSLLPRSLRRALRKPWLGAYVTVVFLAACSQQQLDPAADRARGETVPRPVLPSAPLLKFSAAAAVPVPPAPGSEGLPPKASSQLPIVMRGTGEFVHAVAPESAGSPALATGDITLNFVDADIHEVARSVLGDILHLNYAIDPRLQTAVTVQTSQPLPRDQVLPVFEEVLRADGLALVQNAGLWRVVPLDEASRNASPAIVLGGGEATGERAAAVNLRILPLKFVSAAALRDTVAPFLPKGATLQVDAARNLLILAGASQDLATIANLVSSFDVNWLSAMSFAIYPLASGAPQAIVGELNSIFKADGGAPIAGALRFEPLDEMNAVLVVSSQRAYLDEAKSWIERLDRASDEDTPRFFEYHVQNSSAADLAKVLSQLLSAGSVRTVQVQTAPGATAVQLSQTGMGATVGGGLPSNGLPTGGASSSTGLSGNSLPGNSLIGQAGSTIGAASSSNDAAASSAPQSPSQALDTALGTALGGGEGGGGDLELPKVRIVADEKNNALVIFARPHDYRMIEDAIRQLDIVPLQVLIRATIAEVQLDSNLQYGLQWFFSKGSSNFELSNALAGKGTAADIAGVFPGFNYVLGTANTHVILSALSELTDVDVVSEPNVLVLDHQTATLQVGDEVPIITQSAQSVLTSDAPVVNSVQYLNTGVILQVTPRVNESGLVTLDISQAVSDVKTTTTSNIDSPTITQRQIVTSAVVQDGETIALGGLILNNRNNDKSGIPYLSRLPIVGPLFGTTTRSNDRTELLVLLTPQIVRNTAEMRSRTDELRGRLKSIGAAFAGPQ